LLLNGCESNGCVDWRWEMWTGDDLKYAVTTILAESSGCWIVNLDSWSVMHVQMKVPNGGEEANAASEICEYVDK
jgi:hypothetical protein